ncbi:MAG TPA: alanine--tRNA ligase-related protein [Candidatus Paceibacterota bacterium]|nr:alanine--tRNA ligase-related protein [Candidatus Paceibacterota bacterium]
MTSKELRTKFLKFFEGKGHVVWPSSSLVPENDPSVLFTTAGMQQFKPYYTAPLNAVKDFGSKDVTTSQKCIRTGDIEEVGDSSHLTFFEMLGNFSFGGYGKKEAIEYAHQFITKELGLSISYVTVFEGSDVVPKDEGSKEIWKSLGVENIKEEGMEDVFWGPTGDSGPCGPTTEIYCKNSKGEDIEIWNIVFNEYFSEGSREMLDKGEAKLRKLETFGIDTGMGFERLLTSVEGKETVYDTDLFFGEKTKEERVITDHIKAALFMISDGVVPGNTGREYILRRLIRRAIRFSNQPLSGKIESIKEIYKGVYDLDDRGEIEKEEKKFRETLERGLKEFEKGTDPFLLFTTYGFPIELTEELASEKGQKIDRADFDKKMGEHVKLSQTAAAGMFKGGLANHDPKTVRLHTAHHLLLAALQSVVGPQVKQKGSNINEDRLRMDFICDHKLSDEEKMKVEEWVNKKIQTGFSVVCKEMPLSEAEKIGAEMEFGAKYPETVSVYFIEDSNGQALSKEFCGGPHVGSSQELGKFKIQKEEAVSAGVRRIKATLV